MLIRICISKPLRLCEIALPFDMTCCVEGGTHSFRYDRRLERASSRDILRIPSFVQFDYVAEPDNQGGASATWEIDLTTITAITDAKPMQRESGTLVHAIKRHIFCAPEYEWTCGEVATRLGCTQSKLRALLFAQCESFNGIVLKQRLMRALLGLLHERALRDPTLRMSGMGDARRFSAAFESTFSVNLGNVLDALPSRSITTLSRSSRAERLPGQLRPDIAPWWPQAPV